MTAVDIVGNSNAYMLVVHLVYPLDLVMLLFLLGVLLIYSYNLSMQKWKCMFSSQIGHTLGFYLHLKARDESSVKKVVDG